jgi:acyl-coenzyme A synthetase/AMP-(fatty) acid ligase
MIDGLGADEAAPEGFGVRIVRASDRAAAQSVTDIATVRDEDLLYILFTSGSTGEPKGVMCSHDNIRNTIIWSRDYLDWAADDVIGVAVQLSFDISMFDLFTALALGVPLAIFDKPGDPRASISFMQAAGVTSIFAVPFFFSQFIRSGQLDDIAKTPLRRIVSGGDFFPPAHILEWTERVSRVEVLNVWGPTETSIVNTMHVVTDADRAALAAGRHAPIGRSHPRMEVMLRDESGVRISVPNEAGEICMLGRCVSQGYLGDEALTAKSYFSFDGKRGYRTGDIGIFTEQGDVMMQGRSGSMVKIAGFRIDLNEVETAATGLADIHLAAAFIGQSVPGIDELWLAVEPRAGEKKMDVFSIKQALRKMIPAYMIPKRICATERLPLNVNGKVDRVAAKALLVSGQ